MIVQSPGPPIDVISATSPRSPDTPDAPGVRIAVLDLYNGDPNQGMRALRELLALADRKINGVALTVDIFESRLHADLPGLDYDIYLSSGGPGSPFDGVGKTWEAKYFAWLDDLWSHNQNRAADATDRKHALFICHSFQMMCRHFEVARVIERKSESFGIFPVHKTPAGEHEPIFAGLPDPFYAADFRHWQVVQPDAARLDALGAEILAVEKDRPAVPLERAVMAMRLSPELVGVQFHPEADPPGMRLHFYQEARRRAIINAHGEAKYFRLVHRLEDPTYLARTYRTVIPTFLQRSVEAVQGRR